MGIVRAELLSKLKILHDVASILNDFAEFHTLSSLT
jgi:hypothetical protein